jgi:tetratricopeptide (TPR) repeat protein
VKENSLENGYEYFESDFEPDIEFLVIEVEQEYIPNPLLSFETYKKKIAANIKKNFIDDFHVLRDGYTFIGNYNPQLKEKIRTSQSIKNKLRDLVQVNALLKAGKSFQEILEWTNDDLVDIYALACELLDKSQHYESAAIFKLLCLIRPQCYYFWLNAGVALESDKKTREALATYYGGLYENPYSFELYENICHLLCRQGDKQKALFVLEEINNVLEDSTADEHAQLKAQMISLTNKIAGQ